MPSRPTPPPSTGLRRSVERRSAPLLVFLSHQPKLLVPVVSLVLLIAGLALPGVLGAVCIALLVLLVGWLCYLSWPVVVGPARAVRALTVGLLLVLVVQRLLS
jgi:hypothetical protein